MKHPSTSALQTLLVVLSALLMHLSIAENFANMTMTARLAELVSRGIESPQISLKSALPVEIRYLLTSNGLLWSDLGGTLQRLVLWDAGYVVTRSNTTRQIRVKCDLAMDDVVVSWDEFHGLNNCPALSCTDPVDGSVVRRGTVCADSQIKQVAKCAVLVSNTEAAAASIDVETNMIWAEEGNNTDVPLPTAMRHSLLSFAIVLQPGASSNECPNQLALVAPCTTALSTTANSNSSGWCTPRKSGVVTGVLQDFVQYRQEQENKANAANSSASSGLTLAIWAVATALGLILCVVGFLYARRLHFQRKYPVSKCAVLEKSPLEPFPFNSDGVFFVETNDSKDKTGSLSSDLSDLEAELEAEVQKELDSEMGPTEVDYSDALGASQVLLLFQNDPVVLAKRVPIIDVGGDKVVSRSKDGSATEVLIGCLGSQEVVLKRLRPSRRNDTRAVERLAREIRMATSLQHPNIVNLVGVAWNSFQNLVAIWDIHRGGDLRRALRSGKKSQHWTWAHEKLQIATGVIRGLVFLHTHSPPIIHGAIEPRHILLDASTGEPAICGLGNPAARASTTDNDEESGLLAEDNRVWTSPEVAAAQDLSEKSDVYSFGAIVIALDTGTLLTGVPGDMLLDQLTPECPEVIRQIARDCLRTDPETRPMSESILHRVEDLKRVTRSWASREYPRKTGNQPRHDDNAEDEDTVRAAYCL